MYKKVMVPLDGSKLAECVFPHLQIMFRGCQELPEVVLVSAVEPISVPVGREVSTFSSINQVQEFEVHRKTEARKYLDEKVVYLKELGIGARGEVIDGKAGNALTDYAKKNGIDLVVIATHGRSGIKQLVLGSVAEHILHSATVPVLMIRP